MITVTYRNPSEDSEFDGTPYEAAEKSLEQVSDILVLALQAATAAEIQARNAFMQRRLDTGHPPDAEAWNWSAERKRLIGADEQLSACSTLYRALGKAAGYDPKQSLDTP